MSEKFIKYLQSSGHTDIKIIDGGKRWVGILRFIFTHAILLGEIDDYVSYEDRWCYESYSKAKAALDAWDGAGEPEGWHRHPISGRRRKNGDPLSEYINL